MKNARLSFFAILTILTLGGCVPDFLPTREEVDAKEGDVDFHCSDLERDRGEAC